MTETVRRKVIVPAIRGGGTVMDGVFSDRPAGAAKADAPTAADGAPTEDGRTAIAVTLPSDEPPATWRGQC